MAKVMDNLNRTDFLLARVALGMIQTHYTEQRLIRITTDKVTREQEQLTVNQITPEGEIINNLQLGEYDVVVSSVPERDTFEDSQFDQAVRLRIDAGVQIPDKFIIQASRLRDKAAIISAMEGDQDSPEAKAAAELAQRGKMAEVAGLEADAQNKAADAQLKIAKAKTEVGKGPEVDTSAQELQLKIEQAQAELQLKKDELAARLEMDRQKQAAELAMAQQKMDHEASLKAREMDHKMAVEAMKTTKAEEKAETGA